MLIIILVIVILLHFSLTVWVKGGTGGEFVFKIRYLGITIYPRAKKDKKPKKPKKPKKKKVEDDFDDLDDLDDIIEDFDDDPDELDEGITYRAEEKSEVTFEESEKEDAKEKASEDEVERKPATADEKAKLPEKDKKEKKKKERPKKEDKPPEEISEGEEKPSKLEDLKQKWEFIKPYIPIGLKYTKKLLKTIRIEDIRIDIDTGKEDAAESATFYGKLQAALFSALSLLGAIFTIKVREANVNCLFNVKKLEAEGEATVRVRPSTVIAIGVCLLFCCARLFIPYWLKKRRAKKKAEKEAKKRADPAEMTESAA